MLYGSRTLPTHCTTPAQYWLHLEPGPHSSVAYCLHWPHLEPSIHPLYWLHWEPLLTGSLPYVSTSCSMFTGPPSPPSSPLSPALAPPFFEASRSFACAVKNATSAAGASAPFAWSVSVLFIMVPSSNVWSWVSKPMRILSSGVRLSVPSGVGLSAPISGIIRYRTQHTHYYYDQVWKVTGNHALHGA
jgi:hypothetical protein